VTPKPGAELTAIGSSASGPALPAPAPTPTPAPAPAPEPQDPVPSLIGRAGSEATTPARPPSALITAEGATIPPRVSFPPLGEDRRTPVAVAFFFALFVVSFLFVTYLFHDFIADFILSLLLAGLTAPLYRRILPLVGRRRWLGSALMISAIVLVIALPAAYIAASIYDEAESIYESSEASLSMVKLDGILLGDGLIARQAKRFAKIAGMTYSRDNVRSAVQDGVRTTALFLYERINELLRNVAAFMFHMVIVFLCVFFLLIDGEKLKRYVFRLSPLPSDEEELLAQKFKAVGRAIVIGNGVVSLSEGVLGGIAFAAAGLPSPVLWGTAMALCTFLPLVGNAAVTVPAAIYLILGERYLAAAVFFGFCTVMALVFENVIKPRLIGSRIQMHNVLIFLSIFGGIGVFGVLGILYGPLIVALFLTLAELYEQRYKKRILSIVPPGFGPP
jgi:predicted PurR-regulated permease PerM